MGGKGGSWRRLTGEGPWGPRLWPALRCSLAVPGEQATGRRPRHRRNTRPHKPKVVGVELPRGVLENAGGFGGSGGADRG